MAKMGRPKKKFNRRHITIFIDEGILEKIDEIVAEVKKKNREYTRSDYFNEAARAALERKEQDYAR